MVNRAMLFDHRGNNIRKVKAQEKAKEAGNPRRLAECPMTINTTGTRMSLDTFARVCFKTQEDRQEGLFVYDGAAGDVCRFCDAGKMVLTAVFSGKKLKRIPKGIPEKIQIVDLQTLIKERNDALKNTAAHFRGMQENRKDPPRQEP